MNQRSEDINTTGKIRLISGRYVNPICLTPDEIDLLDIAHGLSHRCRFTGHTNEFYSVAEHSLRVADLVPAHLRLEALLHDASEAYLFDIPSPLKMYFPALVELENNVMLVIAQKFGFSWPPSFHIKQADHQALHEEWDEFVVSRVISETERDGKTLTTIRHTMRYPPRPSPSQVRSLFYQAVRAELLTRKTIESTFEQ